MLIISLRLLALIEWRCPNLRILTLFSCLFFLLGVLPFSPASAADPVRAYCQPGQTSCEASQMIKPLQTRWFLGRCAPRVIKCQGVKVMEEYPSTQKCKSQGSKNVTCTITLNGRCTNSNPMPATCDCTNWSPFWPNGGVVKVTCD